MARQNQAGKAGPQSIEQVCEEHRLLALDARNVFRVPVLIKGELRVPEEIPPDAIVSAFAERDAARGISAGPASHLRSGNLLVLREPIVNRVTMRPEGDYAYFVLPDFAPSEVLETDISGLCRDLYAMPFSEALAWAERARDALIACPEFLSRVCTETRKTAELPDAWHDAGFASLPLLLSPDSIAQMADRELSAWSIPGRRLLDNWASLPEAQVMPAPVNLMASELFASEGFAFSPPVPRLRAMPTRQLHVTAGNAPQIPFFSFLRALATKSAAVVKSPAGALLPGALLALAAHCAAPDHPVTRHLSLVYWPGGDGRYEDALFAPTAFDRIVVWGAPDSVLAVKEKAKLTKTLTFNPRYGVSFIGREAFSSGLRPVALRAVADTLVANQKACIASQIHYVEGDMDQARAYACELAAALAAFDDKYPNYIPPQTRGELRRLMRGLFLDKEWFINEADGFFSSGAVIVPEEFPLSALTMARMAVVRPVPDLSQALRFLHPGVSTVTVFPPERKEALKDEIAARGVSNVKDLGLSGSGFAGQSHDGMLPLCELVDWKNG
ncbi:MAG: acyl-CoA reductase [Thermodesulfobacteriota bacterium]